MRELIERIEKINEAVQFGLPRKTDLPGLSYQEDVNRADFLRFVHEPSGSEVAVYVINPDKDKVEVVNEIVSMLKKRFENIDWSAPSDELMKQKGIFNARKAMDKIASKYVEVSGDNNRFKYRGMIVDLRYKIKGKELGKMLLSGKAKLMKDNRNRVYVSIDGGPGRERVAAELARGMKPKYWV
jgi:predicted hydrolase (HD superfamily)